jgi:hypothetical protein
VFVWFVENGGIVDHHCIEVLVCFADIGGIYQQNKKNTSIQ